jgi:aminoglycoside phosphotransferase (APT) family kinase protein
MSEIVGRGASADVLAWEPGTVLKLFHARYAYAVDLELARARRVHALGAPCPAVLGEACHEGRRGIVYERIDGRLLGAELARGPGAIPGVVARLVELHLTLHALPVPADSGLPRLSESLRAFVARMPPAERDAAEAERVQLPDDTRLCHMDLHPLNVIASGDRLVVVDWVNACAGPLVLDVARSIAVMAWQGADQRSGSYAELRLALAERYREAMLARTPIEPAQLERALGFAADAILREQPANPFGPELRAMIPWLA